MYLGTTGSCFISMLTHASVAVVLTPLAREKEKGGKKIFISKALTYVSQKDKIKNKKVTDEAII